MAVQGTSQLDPCIAVVKELAAIFDRCFETLQTVGAETARLRYLEGKLEDPHFSILLRCLLPTLEASQYEEVMSHMHNPMVGPEAALFWSRILRTLPILGTVPKLLAARSVGHLPLILPFGEEEISGYLCTYMGCGKNAFEPNAAASPRLHRCIHCSVKEKALSNRLPRGKAAFTGVARCLTTTCQGLATGSTDFFCNICVDNQDRSEPAVTNPLIH